jgi:hypothetical protein
MNAVGFLWTPNVKAHRYIFATFPFQGFAKALISGNRSTTATKLASRGPNSDATTLRN